MSKVNIVKNIFLAFSPKPTQRYLDYFWKNAKIGTGGQLKLPPGSIKNIGGVSQKTGFPPKVLQNMAQDRLQLGSLHDIKKIGTPQNGTLAHRIMNYDWAPGLQKGFVRTKRTNKIGVEKASRNLGKNELQELQNHYITPNNPFPTFSDLEAKFAKIK